MNSSFDEQFKVLTGHPPFPWQLRLYDRFRTGQIPTRCNIPTGLGKTMVIPIWLLALGNGAGIPRRLVYVVNRRTVVDQTTVEVEHIRNNLSKVGRFPIDTIAISTLRGQFADNQEWFADPSIPAVICGTVDMIGSRLLFGGYRIGYRARPLHAGFLAQDALIMHDEAHLEPAFQNLLETICCEQAREAKQGRFDLPWPGLKVTALSATQRTSNDKTANDTFVLTDKEKHPPENIPTPPKDPIHHIWRRLSATKALNLHECHAKEKKDGSSKLTAQRLEQELAKYALEHKESEQAVLIFVRRVDDVAKLKTCLKGGKIPDDHVQQLTGTMRGKERNALLRDDPVFARFMPKADRSTDIHPVEGTVYLICTSAGEVGVNLSADQMVCDLSTFDSMVQRFGRVHRFGDLKDARIDVVYPDTFDDKGLNPQRKATLDLLKKLDGDASPLALERLDALETAAAFSPEPTIPPATDILFDAWAMTAIRQAMPGRPPVEPYLHGLAEWEPPRTTVAWRDEVEIISNDLIAYHSDDFLENLLDDYRLKPHELLSDSTKRVQAELKKLVKHYADSPVWIIDSHGQVNALTLGKATEATKSELDDCTILLPPSIGGLSGGLLDGKSPTADDVADCWIDEHSNPRRVRLWDDDVPPNGMVLLQTIDTNPDAGEFEDALQGELAEDDYDPEQPAPKKRRFWRWYVNPGVSANTNASASVPITLEDHIADTVGILDGFLERLGLDDNLANAVRLAAKWHDLGKRREVWQRSIGNPNPTDWYAKSGKPNAGPRWRGFRLDEYRHELGSVLDILDPDQPYLAELQRLSPEMQDVTLHLIAAHHGRARPHFPAEETADPNHSGASIDNVTREIPRRYARLQRCFGRWGLGYLESLLRAADWAASAKPTNRGENQ